MPRKSEKEALRGIRALYALGPVGGLSDSQLVERFLGAEGPDKQDAFAALVHRHGPMVLRVCRRMLNGSADAEDAFQAVFLVLARKAGAVRRVEALKPWLYGVAVRTAKESRRRSARRRAREGGAMDEARVASAADEGLGDLLGLLDEEIDRLPARYREALMLCELEGLSRQNAARQLGLPEGTLSSRLSRGRTLLRDRLAQRGVALGAGGLAVLLPEPSSAALSGPLAETTVRLSLKFAAGGAVAGSVPAAIASLAEGVLAMITVAKLKLVLSAAAALGAAGFLAGGLAWAVGPRQEAPAPDDKPPAALADAKESEKTPGADLIRGIVVDEAGRPVDRAEIRVDAFQSTESMGTTKPDGSFAVESRRRRLAGTAILARSPEGTRIGDFQYTLDANGAAKEGPARIVLKPAREVAVHVIDASKAAVPGASVEAFGGYTVLADATTDARGDARLLLPSDAGIRWILALKSGRGFDYTEHRRFDEQGRDRGAAAASTLPARVELVLDGARTARIKAVGAGDKPLPGVGFTLAWLSKDDRRTFFTGTSRITEAITDADGVATFDWLPPTGKDLAFLPLSEEFTNRRVLVKEQETGIVVARLARTETIRGRVAHSDGSPAAGIVVHAFGSGQGVDHGEAQSRTGADGTYLMSVNPGEAYAVSIDEKDWAAKSRLDVVVREGKSVEGVDFTLTRGTLLRGTVTIDPDHKPAVNQFIRLDETGGPAPEDLRQAGDTYSHVVHRQWGPLTDADGRYAIRLGPGTYTLFGPPHLENQTITIKDEVEVVRDFRMPRPEKGMLSGRVVLAGAEEKGLAGARVEVIATSITSIPFTVTADAEGRFRLERYLVKVVICAKSADGELGAIVELGPEDPEVTIPVAPTATATGRLLDEQGKPAPNLQLYWGRRINLGEREDGPFTYGFAPKVVTNEEGGFTLPSLVVGQNYRISVIRGNVFPATGMVRPEAPGPIDLGTLKIGAYRPKPETREYGETISSFVKDAPGAGVVAPPIAATTLDGKPLSLGDFKGKYILLDFWATWCGPCIAEIPQLQAVHDAFGEDGRFAILSLSVDEKVEEPKAFQEKRKLPWSQAFLGGGVHGPTAEKFGVRAIPAFVLVGPDGKIVARGMRGDDIKKVVARALAARP